MRPRLAIATLVATFADFGQVRGPVRTKEERRAESRGSERAQSQRLEAAAAKRVRRGERFPRTVQPRTTSGVSRSATSASDWRRHMSNNPLADLGGTQLGKLRERGSVRATTPLRWLVLWNELRGMHYVTRERRFQTARLALAESKRLGGRVRFVGTTTRTSDAEIIAAQEPAA